VQLSTTTVKGDNIQSESDSSDNTPISETTQQEYKLLEIDLPE